MRLGLRGERVARRPWRGCGAVGCGAEGDVECAALLGGRKHEALL